MLNQGLHLRAGHGYTNLTPTGRGRHVYSRGRLAAAHSGQHRPRLGAPLLPSRKIGRHRLYIRQQIEALLLAAE
jgi:hypothetical protein